MANIKIFQLLPDVYDVLLGVTNSSVTQDRVAKLNNQGMSACMIQGLSVLHLYYADLPQVDYGGRRARGRERATRATKLRVVDLCRLQEFKSH